MKITMKFSLEMKRENILFYFSTLHRLIFNNFSLEKTKLNRRDFRYSICAFTRKQIGIFANENPVFSWTHFTWTVVFPTLLQRETGLNVLMDVISLRQKLKCGACLLQISFSRIHKEFWTVTVSAYPFTNAFHHGCSYWPTLRSYGIELKTTINKSTTSLLCSRTLKHNGNNNKYTLSTENNME